MRGHARTRLASYLAFDAISFSRDEPDRPTLNKQRHGSASGLETYEYDGNGLRFNLTATNGRTKFQMYAQNGKLMYGTEQAPGYSPATVRYMYLGGKLIAETYGDGTTSYVHTDGLGSPVARSSGTSATPGPYTRYEPYGNSTAAGPAPNPIGFTGHVNDVDTGMIYMQQRYYDSWAGRFLSVDPVVMDAATGGSFGRYHYANDNPYRYTDPDGRDNSAVEGARRPSLPPTPPRIAPPNLASCQQLSGTDCGWRGSYSVASNQDYEIGGRLDQDAMGSPTNPNYPGVGAAQVIAGGTLFVGLGVLGGSAIVALAEETLPAAAARINPATIRQIEAVVRAGGREFPKDTAAQLRAVAESFASKARGAATSAKAAHIREVGIGAINTLDRFKALSPAAVQQLRNIVNGTFH